MKLITKLVIDADREYTKGNTQTAKKVYVAVAEEMHKMVGTIQDDPNFVAALNKKKLEMI